MVNTKMLEQMRYIVIGGCLLVSEQAVEVYDEFIFFFSKVPSFKIWPQVVYPPQPAALATSKQP